MAAVRHANIYRMKPKRETEIPKEVHLLIRDAIDKFIDSVKEDETNLFDTDGHMIGYFNQGYSKLLKRIKPVRINERAYIRNVNHNQFAFLIQYNVQGYWNKSLRKIMFTTLKRDALKFLSFLTRKTLFHGGNSRENE